VADSNGWEGLNNGHNGHSELGASPIQTYPDGNGTLSFSVGVNGTKAGKPPPPQSFSVATLNVLYSNDMPGALVATQM
jgi:hypothetical protein